MAALLISKKKRPLALSRTAKPQGGKRRGGMDGLLKSLLAPTSPSLYPKHALLNWGVNADRRLWMSRAHQQKPTDAGKAA